ncbi:hypothetical protein WK77_16180 [Burkholderia ubonensis]|nr:hypothetical protein WK77_16180 [Burkholderia ubonensis]
MVLLALEEMPELMGPLELTRIAGQIAAAKGHPCAIVMITALDEDYADVVPELIAEDAMRVLNHSRPDGFEIEVLNRSA